VGMETIALPTLRPHRRAHCVTPGVVRVVCVCAYSVWQALSIYLPSLRPPTHTDRLPTPTLRSGERDSLLHYTTVDEDDD
jgi:hypothetical protein